MGFARMGIGRLWFRIGEANTEVAGEAPGLQINNAININ